MVGVEQACMDHGRWELAYRLTLLDEPPSQLWSYRQAGYDPKLKAFAPLCPQRWTTIALATGRSLAPGGLEQVESRPFPSLLSSSSSVRETAIHSREEEGPYDSEHDNLSCSFVSFGDSGEEFDGGSTKNQKIPKSHIEQMSQHEAAGNSAVLGGGSGRGSLGLGFSSPKNSSPELDAPEAQRNEVGVVRQVPFPSWVEQFVRQLLGARTSFSFFLVRPAAVVVMTSLLRLSSRFRGLS